MSEKKLKAIFSNFFSQFHLVRQATTAQQAVWQYGGATNIFSAFVRYSASVSADE